MARRIKITIETGPSLVVVQDYETATGQIYQMKAGGFGEYTMAQYANVDLTNAAAMIALIHSDGTTFQAVAIESIESVTINGVAATITNLSLVRDAVSPYFFNVGNGGYAFTTIVELTPTLLTTGFSAGGIELLPALGAHKYAKFEMDFVNLGDGSEAFASGNVFEIKSNTSTLATVTELLITTAGPTELSILQVVPAQLQGVNGRYQTIFPNTAIILKTISNTNYTISNVANGSRVFVVIRYNIFDSTAY